MDFNLIMSEDESKELLEKYKYSNVKKDVFSKKPLTKVELPYEHLNHILEGGLEEESLWIIGGLPGAGKTTFANQLVEKLSQSFKTASISLEMTDRKSIPMVEKRNLRNQDNFYSVYDIKTISEIENFVSAFKSICTGETFIVIDYLQKIVNDDKSNEKEKLDDVIVRLKELTKKFQGTRIILISSMNSDAFKGENRQGIFSGSRAIEYEVDIASTFVYVDKDGKIVKNLENIDEDMGTKYRRALYFVKNRQGYIHTKVIFNFEKNTNTMFEESKPPMKFNGIPCEIVTYKE